MSRSAYVVLCLSALALAACTAEENLSADPATDTNMATPAPQSGDASDDAAPEGKPASDGGTGTMGTPAPAHGDAGTTDAGSVKPTILATASGKTIPLDTFTAALAGDEIKLTGEQKNKDHVVVVSLPKGVAAGTFPCDATHSVTYDDETNKVLTNQGLKGHAYKPKTGDACSIVVEAAGAAGTPVRGKITAKLAFDYQFIVQSKTDTTDVVGTFVFVHP